MKTVFTFLLLVLGLQCFAENNYLCIKDPDNGGSQGPGSIRDVTIEVTPKGIYAQVDMIFNISDPSGYPGNWEGVMCFDLPEGSFIHDSWLWLDANTIISADIVERDRAFQLYNGVVKRKRDPSLLVKNLSNHYRLSVYPIRSNYARWVKITYSTPFVWQAGRASIVLPTALLGASKGAPYFNLIVNTNSVLDSPSFLNLPFNNLIINQSPGSYTVRIPPAAYIDSRYFVSDVQLVFNARTRDSALIYTYPTNAFEGVYQYVLPAAIASDPKPRSIVYMIDKTKYSMALSMRDIVRAVKNSLFRDLKPTDSFNIFYVDGTNIVKASPSWLAADAAAINAMISSIPLYNDVPYPRLRELLRAALPFTQSKPGAQAVLFGSDPGYSAGNRADTMFANLKAFLGGFTNRIDVVNNTSGGSEYFYTKLCLEAGGIQFKSKGMYYDGYTSNYSTDLELDACLRQICQYPEQSTNAYNVAIPLNGITYSEYEPAIAGKYNPMIPFARMGRFYGAWPNSGDIQVKYVNAAGLQTSTAAIAGTQTASVEAYKSWVYNFMNDLKSRYGGGSKTELIDSSLRNRVLHDYTAFLALETGDTIKTNATAISVGVPPGNLSKPGLVIFPNPFTDELNISCETAIEKIQIVDVTGRLVWEASPSANRVIWPGRNMGGATVNPGIYLVIAIDKLGNRSSAMVEKQ